MQQNLEMTNGNHKQYPSAFEELWKQYPHRAGSTSKQDTFRQWQRRLLEGYEAARIRDAVLAYRSQCDRAGKTGTCYVMQFERFVGRGLHFLKYDHPAVAFPRKVWKPPVIEQEEAVPAGYLTTLLHQQIARRKL